MKYITLLFFFSGFLSSVALAQSNASFGIKAGLSVAGVRGEAANSLKDLLDFTNGRITTTNRTGIYAGVSANIPISSEFSVEPGIFYTQKGYQLNGELGIKGLGFLGANAKATLESDYISMPVLLKANIAGLQIFAGPQVSLLSSAKLRTTAGLLGFNILNESFDATNQLNKWDVGVTGGIGYQLSNGLNISASYDHGLSKMDANQNFSAYNKAFKVGLGLNF